MSAVVKSVCKALERIAPLRLAEPWDKVGLIIESPVPRADARRVVLTIDLTAAVLEETLNVPTALVISYHPPLFQPVTSLTLANPLQASLLKLSAAGTSVFCPHTSLDATWGGINDWLAEGIMGPPEAGKVSILGEVKGEEGGAGRIVTFDDPVNIEELVQRVKKHLSLSQVDVGRPLTDKPITSVAICAGAGGTLLSGVDADVYFTGEMQHHDVLGAIARGRYVILCGHTNTERGYLPVLAQKLFDTLLCLAQEEGSPDGLSLEERAVIKKQQLDIHISEADRHPLDHM